MKINFTIERNVFLHGNTIVLKKIPSERKHTINAICWHISSLYTVTIEHSVYHLWIAANSVAKVIHFNNPVKEKKNRSIAIGLNFK